MSDLKERFRRVDQLEEPDLWPLIAARRDGTDRSEPSADAPVEAGGNASTNVGSRRRPRRAVPIALGVAAVLVLGGAAFAVTHLWTRNRPVAIRVHATPGAPTSLGIADPLGGVSSNSQLEATVAEFAPEIRLPEGGSFATWVHFMESESPPTGLHTDARSLLSNGSLDRLAVVNSMLHASQCQWEQHWLGASTAGDIQGMDLSVRVLQQMKAWAGQRLPDDGNGASGFTLPLQHMAGGDTSWIHWFENVDCPFTGAFGSTPAQQDQKATIDLAAASTAVHGYLANGGDASTLTPQSAATLDSTLVWASTNFVPSPRPGDIVIAPSAVPGITLVSISDSGVQFCSVVSSSGGSVKGTTSADLSVVDSVQDGPSAAVPGPVTCIAGGWPQN